MPDDLSRAVRAFVACPRVLVGLDFDGVLAPIVADRDAARALPGTLEAVRALATFPGTEVVLVSGRALADLGAVTGLGPADGLSLVGSHGAETALHATQSSHPPRPLTADERDRLDQVVTGLTDIVRNRPGSGLDVETKPTGAVLHTRAAPADVALAAEEAAMTGPGAWPGVHAIRGKSVVELTVVETSKGVALQRLRAQLGSDAVLYAGDDVTDETAFAVLEPSDVGVKVGPGASHASYRVSDPEDVRELLQLLVTERSQR